MSVMFAVKSFSLAVYMVAGAVAVWRAGGAAGA
jgi:hypothetical protein